MRVLAIVVVVCAPAFVACGGEASSADGGPSVCGTPGVSFSCGGATCTDALPVCCQYSNVAAQCIARGSTCAVDGGVPRMQSTQCDDANDCGDGGVCYRSFNKGTSQTDFLCGSARPGLLSQVCKLSCECLEGKTCNAGTCQ